MSSHHFRAITLICAFAGGISAGTLYTNGLPDFSDGLEATLAVQASDFTLTSAQQIQSIRFWAAQGSYHGSVYWAILDNTLNQPGSNVLFSGLVSTATATATGDLLAGFDVYRYDFSTGTVALQAGSYWLVLHNGDLSLNSPADFYWLTAAANGTLAGNEALVSGGGYGSFTSTGVELAFELSGTSMSVPESSTWILSSFALLSLVILRNLRKFVAIATTAIACFAASDPVARPGTPTFERPTLTSLGVVLPLSGDDNYNSRVGVRYRRTGTVAWKDALPLHRVRPETVTGVVLQPHYAGSIFHLRPATSYDIELQLIDADGGGQTFNLSLATRAIPALPASPRNISVTSASGLQTALNAALPGDVITLADGIYSGNFDINRAGLPGNPIVVRGQSQSGTILDGAACTGCNVINVYGSGYVYVENLTIRNAERAIRFQTAGATGNVLRRVLATNIQAAVGARDGQRDFYIADNRFEGPITWPQIYSADNGAKAAISAVSIGGEGHVIAHNYFSGWSDSIWQWTPGGRAVDMYGNDFTDQYDNCVEFDFSAGNMRFFRNRMVNAFMPISVQPVRGGPAYVFRNITANVVSEQIKFHAQGSEEPNGVLAYHNTFVSADIPLQVQTSATSHWFSLIGNLIVGPSNPTRGSTVEWNAPINGGIFNSNGYYPDGVFAYNFIGTGYRQYASLAAAQSGAAVESQGFIVPQATFASGYTATTNYSLRQSPPDLALASTSNALDRVQLLPNINDYFRGAGPDAGALERGCPEPVYGPRPMGIDESNARYGCESEETSGTAVWVRNNTTTRGTWPGVYGSRGWVVAGEGASASSAVAISPVNGTLGIWANPSTSLRALRKTPPSLYRIAAGWEGASQVTVEINAKDSNPVQVAAYFLDWQTTPRSQTIEFLDIAGTVLSQSTVSAFQNGVYGVWTITGRVRLRITEGTPGRGVTLSGIFFD